MTLARDQYFLLWKDAEGTGSATSFHATNDAAATAIATAAQAASNAALQAVFKVVHVLAPTPVAAVAGSNVRIKGWAYFKTATTKIIKLSIPSFKESLLTPGKRTFSTDVLTGVGKLVTRAGNVATSFVTGKFNYGLRERDGD